MKRIKPEDLPEILTDDVLKILAEMLAETPVSDEWKECYKKLTDEQLFLVHNTLSDIIQTKEESRKATMTEEERAEEKRKTDKFIENLKPTDFYGNMGQPETIEDLKNRNGEYPSGYDKNGNKIEES